MSSDASADTAVPVITIDGPSGAGKGTLCRLIANATGYTLLDSGALYRLTAVSCMKKNIALDNEAQVAAQAATLDIHFRVQADDTLVMLDGSDVSRDIRTEQAGMGASTVGALPAVRSALLQRQRDFRAAPGLVADGRDMGTVVFPDAPVKVFLTASAEERARRRVAQLAEAGVSADYSAVLNDIRARDDNDSSRAAAPLKAADDALILDSTQLSINQVFQAVMAEVANKIGRTGEG